MLIDGLTLPEGHELRGDVCVVGAGPAGLTTAVRLASSGVRVVLVECGPPEPVPGGDDLDTATSVGRPYPVRDSRASGLGGTAHRWNIVTPAGAPFLRLRELDELDFEHRPEVSSSSWPFGRSTLAPWYAEAWALFGLGPADPARDGPLHGDVVCRAMTFGPAETFTRRLPAVVREHAAVTVVTGLRVTELRGDDGEAGPAPAHTSAVASAVCRSASGTRVTVRATAYVLAAGGIENARLLLASRSGSPAGLGNGHDLVGRFFTEHVHFPSGVLLPPAGRGLDRQVWGLVEGDGRVEQRKYALRPEVLRREGLLSSAFYLVPRARTQPVVLHRDGRLDAPTTTAVDDLRVAVLHGSALPRPVGQLGRLALRSPVLVRRVAREVRGEIARRRGGGEVPRDFTLEVMAEQQQLRDSRVRLGRRLDAAGQPVAELDWRVGDLDLRSMVRSQELLGPVLGEALGARVESLLDRMPVPRLGGGHHHMGTTRMAVSPRLGVVDEDCRVHGVRNLYVAGSSVFPANGFANPTLTLVALAARLAGHLASRLAPALTRAATAGRSGGLAGVHPPGSPPGG